MYAPLVTRESAQPPTPARPGQKLAPQRAIASPTPRLLSPSASFHVGGSLVQTKLTVGPPNDRYEREADRVADAVMRMPEPSTLQRAHVQQKCARCDEDLKGNELRRQMNDETEELQAKPLADDVTPLVQRQPIGEEEEDDLAQPKTVPGRAPTVTPDLEARINAIRTSGGQPLDPATRAFMEPRFGFDFSQVRVHTDGRAAETAGELNARAFTVGRDVVFGNGQYALGGTQGQRLVAHELTHVVQQRKESGVKKQI